MPRLLKTCLETRGEIQALVIPGPWFDNNTGLHVVCPHGECRTGRKQPCIFPLNPERREAVA